MSPTQRVFLCKCSSPKVMSPALRDQIVDGLRANHVRVEVVPDMCGLAARKDAIIQRIAQGDRPCIVACFARAVRGLFEAAGTPLPGEGATILNVRERRAEEIIAQLSSWAQGGEGLHDRPADSSEEGGDGEAARAWYPWFPVIDYDRCTNCNHCLSFCLFDVYGTDENGVIEVQRPEQCKTDCPACARVCPEVAIIFPKYDRAPINGDEVRDKAVVSGMCKVDVSALLGGDALATLRSRGRGRTRFAARDQGGAGPESVRELQELQDGLGIPDAVLKGLAGNASGATGEPGDVSVMDTADEDASGTGRMG